MSSIKLAIQLLKNNLKTYMFYLCVITVTIAIYYNFLALQYNTDVKNLATVYQDAQIASLLCAFILFWVVIFFMWHSNSFFFKQRQKETGLYMLMGITSSKIGKVFAIESMILGGLAFMIGLPIGILFSKLFFMLLAKAMVMDTVLPFSIPPMAIIQLFIIFTLLFILLGIRNYFLVRKSKLIDLINATKKQQQVPNLKYIRGFLGVGLIAGGYTLALNARRWHLELMSTSIFILIIVCIGTYFLFGSFLSILIKKMIENKGLIYKGSRLISFSNILFRLESNYRNLAMTAILSAATVTAFGTALSTKQYADDNLLIEVPYSINYISNDQNIQDKVIEAVKNSKHKITATNQSRFLLIDRDGRVLEMKNNSYEAINDLIKDNQPITIVTSYSEIKKGLESIAYTDKDRVLERIKCEPNEVISVRPPNVMGSTVNSIGKSAPIGEEVYRIKDELKVPFIGKVNNLHTTYGYIVDDEVYTKLKGNTEEIINNGIIFTEPEDSVEILEKLITLIPGGIQNINAYVAEYMYKYYLVGSFYFLGIIMAMVFMLATFSTLYFKVISDALADKQQYTMLKKVGMTKEEVLKSVYLQVGIAFVLPALVGGIHGLVAIKVLEQFMSGSYITQYSITIALFVAIMLFYYIAISKKYFKMVYSE